MYAIVKIAGKQWKLKEQDRILVDKLPLKEKENFDIEQVLLVRKENEVLVGTPFVEKAVVKVKVLEQGRDKKIIVFKKKRRKGYKKTQGHRQYKTSLLVEKILLDGKELKTSKAKATPTKKEETKVTAKPKETKVIAKPKETKKEVLTEKNQKDLVNK